MAEETICLVPEVSEGLEELGICGPGDSVTFRNDDSAEFRNNDSVEFR